jgi:aspartyl-tRNA(Asn)/glutamyl-tRNA(Gln) amidotransferase subunit B
MSATIQGRTGEWEVVIGLEVHAQVVSRAKLFSGAATEFGAEPNANVSFVDAAMPGMLPVINRHCVEQAVLTGLGLKARVNPVSIFDRKNYFYADLPAGYQISQYKNPIVSAGEIVIDLKDGTSKTVGIERLHLEQDAGKSVHDQDPRRTFVDLNRAGVALMEIVSKPDLRGAEEAGQYLAKLRSILRYLGTCDGDMEKGNMRADVNVSVRRKGETEYGTRCEIKNVNSIRFVRQAVEYEARRQVEIIEGGGTIAQETRLFDTAKGETRSMRSKEEAHDYRYFPDPDLLPLRLDPAWIERIRASLPELPDAKKERFQRQYGLSAYDAGQLVGDRETADYFEAAAKGRDGKLVANWLINELAGRLARIEKDLSSSPVSAAALGALVDLVASGAVSGRSAKDVLDEMVATGAAAAAIVAQRGLGQISDTGAIEAAIDAAIAGNPAQAEQYRAGNAKVAGWFVGQVMKATGGKANPKIVNEILARKLGR